MYDFIVSGTIFSRYGWYSGDKADLLCFNLGLFGIAEKAETLIVWLGWMLVIFQHSENVEIHSFDYVIRLLAPSLLFLD